MDSYRFAPRPSWLLSLRVAFLRRSATGLLHITLATMQGTLKVSQFATRIAAKAYRLERKQIDAADIELAAEVFRSVSEAEVNDLLDPGSAAWDHYHEKYGEYVEQATKHHLQNCLQRSVDESGGSNG